MMTRTEFGKWLGDQRCCREAEGFYTEARRRRAVEEARELERSRDPFINYVLGIGAIIIAMVFSIPTAIAILEYFS